MRLTQQQWLHLVASATYFLQFSWQSSLETSHFYPLSISKGRLTHLSHKELYLFVFHIIMLNKWVTDPFSPSARTDCSKMASVVNSMNNRKMPANYPTPWRSSVDCKRNCWQFIQFIHYSLSWSYMYQHQRNLKEGYVSAG